MAAAYAALVSLSHIINQILRPPPTHHFRIPTEQIQSLLEQVSSFVDFLEKYSKSVEFTDDLEERIVGAAHRAEDIIESYVVTQIQARYKKIRLQRERSSPSLQSIPVHEVLKENTIVEVINEFISIREDLDEIRSRKGMEDVTPQNFKEASSSRSLPGGKSFMIGFDEHLNQIRNALATYESGLQIIPVVGMGGVGKTTLATNVYNDAYVVEHFDVRAWVSVSPEYMERDIIMALLQQTPSTIETNKPNADEPENVLHKQLFGRRYFIVLDDLWDSKAWERLKLFLPDNNNGSRILVTTRLLNLAVDFKSCEPYQIGLLNDDYSWDLLEQVFGKEDCPRELEDIGKSIARKCGGLPLALVVIGGLLAKSDKTREFWKYVEENVTFAANDENDEQCMKILRLSYSQLQVYLQPCFLYLAVFPKNVEIRVSRLIKLWVAEGFIKPASGKTLEEVAEGYLNDLLDRNLIMASKRGLTGKMKTCSIHDLVRDLITREVQKNKFLCIAMLDNFSPHMKSKRRLSIHTGTAQDKTCEALRSATLNRSFLSYSEWESRRCLDRSLNLLRILDVVDFYSMEELLRLFNSRYITCDAPRESQVSSLISLLWNLQSLVVPGSLSLPSEIWQMPQLRHLKMPGITLPDPQEESDSIIVLENLQTLSTVKDFIFTEQVLERIPNLKKLGIRCDAIEKLGFLSNLAKLQKLESLVLEFSGTWENMAFPESLKKLSLSYCEIPWEDMHVVGSLPNLEVLKLQSRAAKGQTWSLNADEFCRLKFLLIEQCEIETWVADDGYFPCLEHLHLASMKMKEIPMEFAEIPTLQTIDLNYCSRSLFASAKNISKKRKYFGCEEIQVRSFPSENGNSLMAEAVVSIALQTLGDLLLEKGKLLFGVDRKVKALETQLKEIECFLEDADKKQHKSKIVRSWIDEIRDLAYKAEDVVAEYSVRMSLSSSSYLSSPGVRHEERHSSSLLQLSSEMSDIKSELERITKAMEGYGIKNIIDGAAGSSDNQILARRYFPNFEIGDCFVGKEEDLKQLVSLVVDNTDHPVISVWGMDGIGKTTIAKKVYNQMKEARNSYFDCFAWVCISQQCQIRTVLEDILKQMGGGSVSDLSDLQLMKRLCEIQRNKRCLIVVDNLWEISHWSALKHAFPLHNLQSKILVTTRNQKVAEIGFSVKLGVLNMEEGLELLKKKAFPLGRIRADIQIDEIGIEMVEKCGYLPLAISLLGGVLSKRKSMAELMLVIENVNAYLDRGDGNIEGENEMHAMLNLSYEDLPYYLKPCFLYLGIFKEDEEIRVDDLYKRWIAQGMISDEMIRGEETLVDIAELYFGELASRCMLQVEVDSIRLKQERICKLHHAVREFCLSTGKKEEFGVEVLEYRDGNFASLLPVASRSINKTRHLAIHFPGEEIQPEGGGDLTISNCEHLRSLELLNAARYTMSIPFPPESIIDFEKFKVLRELLIENVSFKGRKLPRGITMLVHLRYFGLRNCEHLDKLRSSICNLVNLDTLDLDGSWNLRVPNVFKKMRRFKHLILPYHDEETIGDYRLRLDEGVDELETLQGFDSRVHELKSTGRMKNLRRFDGRIHDNKSLSTIVNAIREHWNKLQVCSLKIRRGCKLRGSSSDEVVLRLEECEIEDPMPMGILANLHCLTHLTISGRSYVSEEMTFPTSSFPHLKLLILYGLEKLREWRVEQGAMPLLSRLVIHDCSNLREWRVEQGAMPLLSELYLLNCPGLKKVPDEVSSISAEDKLNIIEENLAACRRMRSYVDE